PLTLLQIFDRILLFEALSTLGMLVLGVVAALFLEGFLQFLRSYIGAWLGARFEHLSSIMALERLLYTNLRDFERQGAGLHLERLNALNILKDFYSGQAVLTLLDVPFVFLYLGLIYYLGNFIVLIPILVFVLFILTAISNSRQIYEAVKNRTTLDDRRIDFIIEVLSGVHSVKAMAMEAMMLRRYERLQDACAASAQTTGLLGNYSSSMGNFFAQLNMIFVVAWGATMVIHQELTIGGLAACTMLSGRAIQPLNKAIGLWTRFQSIRVARDRVGDIFDLELEPTLKSPSIPSIHGGLEMRNVSYKYAPDAPPMLHDVNITIKPGESVAILGSNGCGKTSLLWLMMGALAPSEGKVILDGHDLSQYNPQSIRKQVAYLPQSGVLFQGSIRDNITMFRPELDEKAEEITRQLGLEEFLNKMPKGYDTVIDDGAAEILPRGIKQRVAIARSLMDDPNLVLFDEANTAMDSQGDNMLMDALEKLKSQGVTLVLVTLRPSLVRTADRVYEIKDGTVVLKEQDKNQQKGPPAKKPQASEQKTPPAASAGNANKAAANAPAPKKKGLDISSNATPQKTNKEPAKDKAALPAPIKKGLDISSSATPQKTNKPDTEADNDTATSAAPIKKGLDISTSTKPAKTAPSNTDKTAEKKRALASKKSGLDITTSAKPNKINKTDPKQTEIAPEVINKTALTPRTPLEVVPDPVQIEMDAKQLALETVPEHQEAKETTATVGSHTSIKHVEPVNPDTVADSLEQSTRQHKDESAEAISNLRVLPTQAESDQAPDLAEIDEISMREEDTTPIAAPVATAAAPSASAFSPTAPSEASPTVSTHNPTALSNAGTLRKPSRRKPPKASMHDRTIPPRPPKQAVAPMDQHALAKAATLRKPSGDNPVELPKTTTKPVQPALEHTEQDSTSQTIQSAVETKSPDQSVIPLSNKPGVHTDKRKPVSNNKPESFDSPQEKTPGKPAIKQTEPYTLSTEKSATPKPRRSSMMISSSTRKKDRKQVHKPKKKGITVAQTPPPEKHNRIEVVIGGQKSTPSSASDNRLGSTRHR
ncbi:MAG: ATP-binding cassette domain-containing protein, partial [Magnetococcales bacterium]|nr:ATP-binding cassette domain-containing protein [Magnetococcales bacterium]